MENWFRERINYSGDVQEISKQICKDYNLGKFISNKLILMGFEDFNFILETSKGKYFVKIFRSSRTLDDCKRYITIIEKALKAGISTPKLYKSNQGYLHIINIDKSELRLCVAEFIDGKTFFELNCKPNNEEIKFLAQQAALINSLDLKVHFIYDDWAITNFLKEFKENGKYLSERDVKLIAPLVQKFKDIKIETLPHCFVHGDIIATNTMKDVDGKLWIIDFSVSNNYPRIQELAVLACNLLFNEESKEISEKNLKLALEEYQKTIKLTPRELEVLPNYIKLARAIYLLGANYQRIVKNVNTRENEYWLTQGRKGLLQNNN